MPAGVYIHIPFCKSRCSYCDFATDVYRNEEAVERYVQALLRETGDRTPETGSRSQRSEDWRERAPEGRKDVSPGQAGGAARGADDSMYRSRVAATPSSSQESEAGSQETQGKSKEQEGLHDSVLSPQHSVLPARRGRSGSVLSPQHSALPAERLRSDTIYFGGGTPSLLKPDQLGRILKAVHERFDVAENAEITVEMNPATVSLDQLRDFRSLGVNRASFGVQTFDDRSLKLLARGHDADDARRTYDLLRQAGFDNISFDLIAGLPGQTLEDWERNLDEAVAMSPEHVSLYLLEIHEATPLAEQVRSGRQPVPDEELAAEMYDLMLERLEAAGYSQYEISNFSRTGRESRHNLKYWELDPVIGFGVSAHSFDGADRRWSNVRDTKAYVSAVELGDSPVVEDTVLSPKQLMAEFAFLKLRLNKGLDLREYKDRFASAIPEGLGPELERLSGFGLIEISAENVLKLTRKGMVYSNEVFEIFV